MLSNFAILDPRPLPAAAAANDAVFASGPVYGVEVTVPALAARCVVNLDPQHAGQDADLAAIEAALTAELPPEGATLVTVRADLDAVGAMAVLAMRARGVNLGPAMGRILLVAESDKFARGGYPGPRSLPTSTDRGAGYLAAIAAAIVDFKVPMASRVATMERWLLTGEEPEQYRTQVELERADMVRALETGDIKAGLVADGRIAVVESAHRAATSVGYSLAPVVVARNPVFRLGGGEAHTKFTVCAFEVGWADIKSALAELAQLEQGWGGSGSYAI